MMVKIAAIRKVTLLERTSASTTLYVEGIDAAPHAHRIPACDDGMKSRRRQDEDDPRPKRPPFTATSRGAKHDVADVASPVAIMPKAMA